jgi:1,4-dihydroxy-2-naphthoate octaprenyltransferase
MPEDLYRIPGRFAWLSFLLSSALLFALGAGMARYLGAAVVASSYLFGQLWVLGVLFMTYFLRRYFNDRDSARHLGRMVWRFFPWKTALLAGAATGLTVSVAMTFLLIQTDRISQGVLALLIGGIFGAVAYGVPPFKLAEAGYGELLLSLMVAAGVPSIAFLLFYGEYHRILPMATFPLGTLHLAMLVAYGFPKFAADRRLERKSLLMRMGWENGMVVHNVLILAAFLLLGIAAAWGFPSFAAFPPFLLLPLAVLQVVLIQRVAAGGRPNWNAIVLGPIALFGVLAYIFAFSFWTH